MGTLESQTGNNFVYDMDLAVTFKETGAKHHLTWVSAEEIINKYSGVISAVPFPLPQSTTACGLYCFEDILTLEKYETDLNKLQIECFKYINERNMERTYQSVMGFLDETKEATEPLKNKIRNLSYWKAGDYHAELTISVKHGEKIKTHKHSFCFSLKEKDESHINADVQFILTVYNHLNSKESLPHREVSVKISDYQ